MYCHRVGSLLRTPYGIGTSERACRLLADKGGYDVRGHVRRAWSRRLGCSKAGNTKQPNSWSLRRHRGGWYKTERAQGTDAGEKRIGDVMEEKVFEPGRTRTWNDLTKHATGEGLNAKAFAKDFGG